MKKYRVTAATAGIILLTCGILQGQQPKVSFQTYDCGGSGDAARTVASDGSGGFFVLANRVDGSVPSKVIVLRYHDGSSTPDMWWYAITNSSFLEAVAFAVDATNVTNPIIYVSAYAESSGVRTFRTLKFDSSSGVPVWVNVFACGAVGYPVDVADAGQGIVDAGACVDPQNPDEGLNYCLLRYASDGTLEWPSYWDGGAERADAPSALAIGTEGTDWFAYMTGRSDQTSGPTPEWHVWTVKCNSDGDLE